VVATADPKLKAEVYEEMGFAVKYDPRRRLVSVESRPPSACRTVGVGGGTTTNPDWRLSPWSCPNRQPGWGSQRVDEEPA
jgi:hypothetical protein